MTRLQRQPFRYIPKAHTGADLSRWKVAILFQAQAAIRVLTAYFLLTLRNIRLCRSTCKGTTGVTASRQTAGHCFHQILAPTELCFTMRKLILLSKSTQQAISGSIPAMLRAARSFQAIAVAQVCCSLTIPLKP